MKNIYITAVLEKLQAGQEPKSVLSGLDRTLKQRGHERLYAPILRGVNRVLSAGRAENTQVTVATELAFQAQKEAIATALKQLGAAEDPRISIDNTIIGGFITEANNRRLDHSHKTKLVTLYRNLTNSS